MGLDDKNDERLDENAGFTEFPGANTYGEGPPLSGKFAAFFKSFFGTKRKVGRPVTVNPVRGDVIKAADAEEEGASTGSLGMVRGGAKLPQVEYQRRRRYNDYEKMDEYPEIGAAIDIYADDSTQTHLDGTMINVVTETQEVKNAVQDFVKTTDLDKYLWDIIRNMCKYGDCFVENIVDMNNPTAGIQRLKILNPAYIYRREDKFGYLKGFRQEVPGSVNDQSTSMGRYDRKNTIELDREQLVHFRIHTSDSNYYPYGKSICAPGVRAWKSLRMMEDAMLIYRLHRAPERRIFYIDTGNLPQNKVERFMERIKAKFKKEKFYNTDSGNADERYNPISGEEDFFVPVSKQGGTKIETLPGAQNLGDIDDVRYFRDKVLAAMKIPKDFIVEKDKSPERKANLSQLDAKFAKAVMRVQRDAEVGLTDLVRRHLQIRNFPKSTYANMEIKLAPPSDLSEKRKLELAEQKTRVVQAVKGLDLFSNEYIYKNFYDMNDLEIEEIKKQKELEAPPAPEPGAAPAAPGSAPGAEQPPAAPPPPEGEGK